jgi:hypothetical protein
MTSSTNSRFSRDICKLRGLITSDSEPQLIEGQQITLKFALAADGNGRAVWQSIDLIRWRMLVCRAEARHSVFHLQWFDGYRQGKPRRQNPPRE